VPGLEGHAQLDLGAAGGEIAEPRKAEVQVRREPLELDRIAEPAQLVDRRSAAA